MRNIEKMFWKKKILDSKEYQDLIMKIVKLTGEIDILQHKVITLETSIRKIQSSVKWRKKSDEIEPILEETQIEKDLKDDGFNSIRKLKF